MSQVKSEQRHRAVKLSQTAMQHMGLPISVN